MKRIAWLLLALVLAYACIACGGPYAPEGAETGNEALDADVLAVLQEACKQEHSLEENVRAVYNWVAEAIAYRASTADLSEGFTEEATQALAAELLAKRRGACDGEAALLAVLLRRMGLECVIVEGQFLREDGSAWVDHAWVIAEIDGGFYHLDPLYGRYYAGDEADRYCMADDAFFLETHRWDQAAYPTCEGGS